MAAARSGLGRCASVARALGLCAAPALLLLAACTRTGEAPVRSPLDDRGPQPSITVLPDGFAPPSGTPLVPSPGGAPAGTATAAPPEGAAGGSPERETAVASALDALAARSGLPAARFTLDRAEPVTWTDGCLEVSVPGLACSQALVPGYRVLLRYQTGSLHEVRTGPSGQAAWAPQTTLHASVASVGGVLTLVDDAGKRYAVLVGPGTRLVDVTLATLRPGDRVAAGVDDLRDGTALRAAWLARE